jgi:hypothetical protein
MASASFSVVRGGQIDSLSVGAQAVTEGTAAIGTGDLEVRIDLTKGWTKNEIELAMDTIWRYIENSNNSTSIPM